VDADEEATWQLYQLVIWSLAIRDFTAFLRLEERSSVVLSPVNKIPQPCEIVLKIAGHGKVEFLFIGKSLLVNSESSRVIATMTRIDPNIELSVGRIGRQSQNTEGEYE
jgi:hypothetical protein